jgi:hypothetical protein
MNISWIFHKAVYKIILCHWKLFGLRDFSNSCRKWYEYGLFTKLPSWSNIKDTFPEVINSRNFRDNIFFKVIQKRHSHTKSILSDTYWSIGGTQEILRINNSVKYLLEMTNNLHWFVTLLYSMACLLHVSAVACHHQGAS